MIKIARREITLPILLLLISFLLWKHIPSLQFVGEGFYYFSERTVEFNLGDKIPHDMFARLLFANLPRWFGSSVHLYMWVQFVYMLFIDFIMYFLVRILTGSRLAGFLTAFLFSTSFIAKFDMFSIGGYQYFLQRAVVLLPHILALMFLILYFLRNFSIKYYFLSLLLYLLGIMMGFFGTWFLPPFIFFPYFFLFFHLRNIKRIFLKIVWTPIPFLIGNILIIRNNANFSGHEESFLHFLFYRPGVLSGVIHQLGVLTLPVGTYEWMTKFLSLNQANLLISRSDQTLFIGLVIFILYGTAFLVIWKLNPSWRIFAATSIVSMISMLLLNLYLHPAAVLTSFGSSRYLYFPFVFIALFWGLFLTSIFSQRKPFIKYFVIVFCSLWIFYNNSYIQNYIKIDEWKHRANRETIDFLRSHATYLRESPSYVYLPANLGSYGAAFAFRYFSHPDGKFRRQGFEDLDLFALARERVDPEKLYVLYYDPGQQIVIDKTEESRALLRQLLEKKKIDGT